MVMSQVRRIFSRFGESKKSTGVKIIREHAPISRLQREGPAVIAPGRSFRRQVIPRAPPLTRLCTLKGPESSPSTNSGPGQQRRKRCCTVRV